MDTSFTKAESVESLTIRRFFDRVIAHSHLRTAPLSSSAFPSASIFHQSRPPTVLTSTLSDGGAFFPSRKQSNLAYPPRKFPFGNDRMCA